MSQYTWTDTKLCAEFAIACAESALLVWDRTRWLDRRPYGAIKAAKEQLVCPTSDQPERFVMKIHMCDAAVRRARERTERAAGLTIQHAVRSVQRWRVGESPTREALSAASFAWEIHVDANKLYATWIARDLGVSPDVVLAVLAAEENPSVVLL